MSAAVPVARGARAATWAAIALAILGCALLLPGAAFLSDDLAQLAYFGRAEAQGRLGALAASKFAASTDGVNGFWRPLAYATQALSYAVGGADARGWLAVNLALHLASAVLVGALVRRLGDVPSQAAALFAAAVFFAASPGWEAVLWIICRYDTLATFLVLLAGWCFASGKPRAALLATALALAAKESGSVAFLLIAAIAAARSLDAPSDARQRLHGLVRELAPFLVLGVAYVALRVILFGHPTRTYVGAAVDPWSLGHWSRLAASLPAWMRANFPGFPGARVLLAAAVAALLALGLAFANTARERRMQLAVMAALLGCLALLLPHLRELDPSGLGGRLFHLPGALVALWLGLALQGVLAAPGRNRGVAAAGIVLSLALAAVLLWWGRDAVREYRMVHREMREAVAAIAAAAQETHSPPAVLFVPDMRGRVAFGRNGQAGLVLPPVQAAPLAARVLVQLDVETGRMPGYVRQGLFDVLPRRDLFEVMERPGVFDGARAVEPSRYACWHAGERRFTAMAVGAGSVETLGDRVAEAYDRAGCRAALARK